MNDEQAMQRAYEHAVSHGWDAGLEAYRLAWADGYNDGTRAVVTGKVRWMPAQPAFWSGAEWQSVYEGASPHGRWVPWPK